MEKEQLILEFMKNEKYIPMKFNEIAMILNVPKEEKNTLKDILKKLEKDFKIEKNKKGKYKIIEDKYLNGKFRANEKGFGFVKIDDEEEEIFISPNNTNNALNEDIVLIKIIKEKETDAKREGKIVKVLEHTKTTVVGTFENNRNFGFVIPDDKKIGTDIFISKKNFGGAKNRQKVVAQITKFPQNNKNAEGKIIEIIGNINEAGIDMLSVIKENNLPYEFPEFVTEEAKKIKNEIDIKAAKNRRDLRKQTIFTIDGEDAKDLDDAVCVEKNEDGNYMLHVHIADVSYYVKEEGKIDKEAIARGTSIYMFDRVIPMLPVELSNGICSLNAKQDRYALSASMEIDKNGNVISSEIYKSIINVKERMTYTDVYKIITESDKKVLNKYKDYIDKFKLMEELALILKNKRLKNGYLNLDIPESKIVLDKSGRAIDVKKNETTFANEIIEQFMLTTNEMVAEKFYWLEAPFIYRVHETPDIDKIKELNKFLYNFGYKIKGNKENIYPKAFSDILENIKGKEEEKVISNLILRTLKVADYQSENKGHFGISSKYYCHFTSPIRRYPDLFIHRIISKYIENDYNMNTNFKEKYEKLATEFSKTSSEREKIAQKVERESEDITKAEFMQNKIGEIYEGIISNITSFGMFVELENTVEGLIRFENLGNEYFIYNEEHKQLIGEKTNVVYKIGDKIKIQVIDANKELRKISFARID